MEVETTSLGRQREQPPDDWGRIIRNDDDGQGKREDVGRADDSSDSGESDPEAQAEVPVHHAATAASQASSRSRTTRIASISESLGRHGAKRERLAPVFLPQSDLDNGIVGWDGQDDPEMPLMFTARRKWLIVGLLSGITFITPFASSILAPGIRYLEQDFQRGAVLASMPVSIYLLGYAVGPLFLSPLSEIYGRNIILTLANSFFCVWQVGCALAPTLESLIVFRFFAGIGGSACITLGGAVIGDMFPVDQRGTALSVWTIGPLIGPTIGPLVGAFVAEKIGWRWDFWITLIIGGPLTLAIFLLNRETNHQVLIQRKVKKLSRELGRDDLKSVYEDASDRTRTRSQILRSGLLRPMKLLFLSPLVLGLSTYLAFAYGCLYLLFNSIPPTFEGQYGWNTGLTGLTYLSIGVGYAISLWVFSRLSDSTVVRLTRKNGGVYEPEMRLPFCLYFAILMPMTFFWYGWAAEKQAHWIVPVIGLFPFGFGILGVWQPIQAYLIDTFMPYSASALAAFTVFRSIVGAFLPLAGPKLFSSLGVGWGNSLLGFICITLIPVPLLVYRYGARMRAAQKIKL